MAICPRRDIPRASSRLATFAQAIRSTSVQMAKEDAEAVAVSVPHGADAGCGRSNFDPLAGQLTFELRQIIGHHGSVAHEPVLQERRQLGGDGS